MTLRLARNVLPLLALAAAGAAAAQPFAPVSPPRLQVAKGEAPIELASLDVHVAIHGLHAQTTETVVFHNRNARVLEGELQFPLPDGATVSGYAIDVDGQLVDGVVVPKQKARVVLETEIRRGVDPGLVEQVRGNVYRARIYPIPARGTRTVRLRWVSDLTTRREEAAYHLPLPAERLRGFSLKVEVVRAPVAPELSGGFGNLVLKQAQDRWVAEARFADVTPSRDLLVRLPKLPSRLVDVEPGEGREAFFSVSDVIPAARPDTAAPPHRIALAWDASGSREASATERELAFLRSLLSAWPTTAVDLVVFRDRAERPVAFAAREGGRRLEAALRAAPVDGGTALAALDLRRASLPQADDALWILVSDGLGTLGEAMPHAGGVPVWTVTGATGADRALLRRLSAETGGELVDLVALDAAGAAAALTAPRVRLLQAIPSAADAIADVQVALRADRARVQIFGRLLAGEAELALVFGDGRGALERRIVKLRRDAAAVAGESAGVVATAWAQSRAEELGLFPDRNERELVALGQRFGLVTAGTSLLVLETLAQHLEHRIVPAATRKALLAQYLARAGELEKQKERDEKDQLERVVKLWNERVRWWETKFRVRASSPSEAKGGATAAEASRRMGARREAPAPELAPSAPRAAPAEMGDMAAGAAASREMRALQYEAKTAAEPQGGGSTEASIAVKPWDPKVPYLESLRRAAPGQAYAAYLEARRQWAGPAFFLDCAGFFLRAGDKALGIRILTNLAEARIDDAALLRVLGWRLAEAGELDLAAGVLEKVLRLRPEEPQSRRDLALVLADRAEAQDRPADVARAVDLLWEVGRASWTRFPEIEVVALMELNRVLARAERRGWRQVAAAERVDPRLRKLLDVDLRVSLAWDADLTDVDLHVFEPDGDHAFFGHRETRMGGLVSHDITQGYGPEEYVVRRALPGAYALKVHYYGSGQQTLVGPATMVATVYTNWGRPDEKRQILTLRLDSPREMEEVGVVQVGGSAPGARVERGRTCVLGQGAVVWDAPTPVVFTMEPRDGRDRRTLRQAPLSEEVPATCRLRDAGTPGRPRWPRDGAG